MPEDSRKREPPSPAAWQMQPEPLELVADTNILFSFFWKGSGTRRLIEKLELHSPEYALEEINGHSAELMEKAGITEKEFSAMRKELAIAVEFVPFVAYSNAMPSAQKASPDSDDVDFLALALKLGLPLWSNDRRLRSQSAVLVLSTFEVLGRSGGV